MNLSTLWLNNFDSFVSKLSICGLINFIMDLSTLSAKKLVPLWILISSCDEFVHLWTFYPHDTNSSTYGLNHGPVHFMELVNFMG